MIGLPVSVTTDPYDCKNSFSTKTMPVSFHTPFFKMTTQNAVASLQAETYFAISSAFEYKMADAQL
jgi:hypothetical protein